MKRFDLEDLFFEKIQSGINFFCGAGFSVEAHDKGGKKLPVGDKLLLELKEEFSCIKNYSNLAKAATKLKSTDSSSFEQFLTNRFSVEGFNNLYLELCNLNIKKIYTTNIDNLWDEMFKKSKTQKCISDKTKGEDIFNQFKIDYYPLHGYVLHKNPKYIFTTSEVATAFSVTTKSSWEQLTLDSAQNAMLFWGWNFQDSAPIEAMFQQTGKTEKNILKWILVHDSLANNEEDVDFLKTLGFNIIIGDTLGLLTHIKQFNERAVELNKPEKLSLQNNDGEIASQYALTNDIKNSPKLPLAEYFTYYVPEWSYILSSHLPTLQYYSTIINDISAGKNVAVIGMRCSGKTTLMMQIAYYYFKNESRIVHIMKSPSEEEVEVYLKTLSSKKNLLFVDDCFRDTNAILKLLKSNNVQLIFFDRTNNYENQVYRFKEAKFEIYDLTELSQEDAQNILDCIPNELLKKFATTKNHYKDKTIINLLASNLKIEKFKFLQHLIKNDEEVAQTFLMICYVHSCGVPCSFDMLYSFLGGDKYSYYEMFEIIDRASGLIREYDDSFAVEAFFYRQQDYYVCRSRFLAEKILSGIQSAEAPILAQVLNRFLINVPTYKICLYDKFKRSAYDSSLISKAFKSISEGEGFYKLAAWKDDSEFIFQQAALYFSHEKQYDLAFEWIERAKSLSKYNKFSINSTYAQIYFDANIKISNEESEKALEVLKECCENDLRKSMHLAVFAKNSLRFDNLYSGVKSICFLQDAYNFIDSALNSKISSFGQQARNELIKLQNKIKEKL